MVSARHLDHLLQHVSGLFQLALVDLDACREHVDVESCLVEIAEHDHRLVKFGLRFAQVAVLDQLRGAAVHGSQRGVEVPGVDRGAVALLECRAPGLGRILGGKRSGVGQGEAVVLCRLQPDGAFGQHLFEQRADCVGLVRARALGDVRDGAQGASRYFAVEIEEKPGERHGLRRRGTAGDRLANAGQQGLALRLRELVRIDPGAQFEHARAHFADSFLSLCAIEGGAQLRRGGIRRQLQDLPGHAFL